MKILVTGATGYIGSAVAEAAHGQQHEVHALAHDASTAADVRERGWTPVAGDLRDAAGLEGAAREFDAVLHVANVGGADAAQVDTDATRALLRGLAPRGGTLVYTSGAWVLGPGRSDEASTPRPVALVSWRGALEQEVLQASGVRGVVIRPGIVYGGGGGIPAMLGRGELPVIAPGTQRWPLVHRDDLARLYLLALSAPAGAVLHGVGTTMSMAELAALATQASGIALETVTPDVARERLGAFADALALDQDVASEATRALVGWQPAALGAALSVG